jgi:hypothetical protein
MATSRKKVMMIKRTMLMLATITLAAAGPAAGPAAEAAEAVEAAPA